MSPQPFKTLGGRIKSLSVGYKCAAETAPDVAALAGQLLGTWSAAESGWTRFLTRVLGAEPMLVGAILKSLRDHGAAKKRIFDAAITHRFRAAPEDFVLVKAVVKRHDAMAKVRHRIAHDFWATSPDHPDVLILILGDAMTMSHAADEHMRRFDKGTVTPTPGGHRVTYLPEGEHAQYLGWTDDAFYYTAAELRGHITEIQKVCELWGSARMLASLDKEEAQRGRVRLSTLR